MQNISIRLSESEQAMVTRWSLGMAGLFAAGALLLVGAGLFASHLSAESALPRAGTTVHHACAGWDATARETIAALVRQPGDAALRQVGDVVFRLRRARRNCAQGWLKIACQDYQVITGRKETDPLPVSSPICWPALQTDASAKAE
jgi:hypothetical protein